MRIAVNARLLLAGRYDGISIFARETLKRIARQHSEHEFVFLFDRPFASEFLYADNVRPVVLFPPTRHPLLLTYFMEKAVPEALVTLRPDLFLSPDGWLSLRLPTPSLPVIHDLNFAIESSFIPFHCRLFYNTLFPRYARKATRIATVSEFSKRDLQSIYGVPAKKIDVIYNGVSSSFQPLKPEKIKEVRRRISDDRPYFLLVGAIHPRKNVANQIRAFHRFQGSESVGVKLVIVGDVKWGGSEIARLIRRCGEDNVKLLGSLSHEELPLVIGSATALCYVSYYEGFGVPPVEAMRAGVPVITSRASAMTEICGDATVQVNPGSVDEIHRAMVEIVKDEALRQSLIKRGSKTSRGYSWDKTAARLWESVERTLDSRSAATVA